MQGKGQSPDASYSGENFFRDSSVHSFHVFMRRRSGINRATDQTSDPVGQSAVEERLFD